MYIVDFFRCYVESDGVGINFICFLLFWVLYKYPEHIPSFMIRYKELSDREKEVDNRITKIFVLALMVVDILVTILIIRYIIIFNKPWHGDILLDVPTVIGEIKSLLWQ